MVEEEFDSVMARGGSRTGQSQQSLCIVEYGVPYFWSTLRSTAYDRARGGFVITREPFVTLETQVCDGDRVRPYLEGLRVAFSPFRC